MSADVDALAPRRNGDLDIIAVEPTSRGLLELDASTRVGLDGGGRSGAGTRPGDRSTLGGQGNGDRSGSGDERSGGGLGVDADLGGGLGSGLGKL